MWRGNIASVIFQPVNLEKIAELVSSDSKDLMIYVIKIISWVDISRSSSKTNCVYNLFTINGGVYERGEFAKFTIEYYKAILCKQWYTRVYKI